MEVQHKKTWAMVVRVSVFTALFAVLFVLVSYVFRPTGWMLRTFVGLYAEPENSLDVVCIGGSDVFQQYSPLQAFHENGYTSYNLAGSALSPLALRYCMDEARKTQPNALYVVSLRSFEYGYDRIDDEGKRRMYSDDVIRRVSDSMKYSANRTAYITYVNNAIKRYHRDDAAFADFDIWEYSFDLIKYHGRWNELSKSSFSQYTIYSVPESDYKRFRLSPEHTPLERVDVADIVAQAPLAEEIDGVLTDLLTYCRELEDLDILFVIPPCLVSEEFQMTLNYIGSRVADYGFDYMNLNEYCDEMGLDFSTDFMDVNHLNIRGAEKCTSFFGDYLNATYDLPDKREDPAYAAWEQEFQQMEAAAVDVRAELAAALQEEREEG